LYLLNRGHTLYRKGGIIPNGHEEKGGEKGEEKVITPFYATEIIKYKTT
jgi:hypothetical protein